MNKEEQQSEKMATELATKLIEICETYSVEQVSSATFNIMMQAVDGNDCVTEKLAILSIVLQEVSKAYNELIIDSHKPNGVTLN